RPCPFRRRGYPCRARRPAASRARSLHWRVAMADARPVLEVEPREERGSRASRRLRRSGYVPGVVYGGTNGAEGTAFKVEARRLRSALLDASALIDLKVGSDKTLPVIVKEQQLHPVRGDVLHVDLLEVRLDEKIHTTVLVDF